MLKYHYIDYNTDDFNIIIISNLNVQHRNYATFGRHMHIVADIFDNIYN